jgi:hypothetical protein
MAEEVTEGGSKLPLIIGGVVVVGVIGAIWLMSKKKKTYATVAPTDTTDSKPQSTKPQSVGDIISDVGSIPQSTKPQSVGSIVSSVGSVVSPASKPDDTPPPPLMKDNYSSKRQLISLGEAILKAQKIIEQVGWNTKPVWQALHNGADPTGRRTYKAGIISPFTPAKSIEKLKNATEWEQSVPLVWMHLADLVPWAQDMVDKLNKSGYIIRAPFGTPSEAVKRKDVIYPIDMNTAYNGEPIGNFSDEGISDVQKRVLAGNQDLLTRSNQD